MAEESAMNKTVVLHANNQGADQPAQRRRLVSASVVHFLESNY